MDRGAGHYPIERLGSTGDAPSSPSNGGGDTPCSLDRAFPVTGENERLSRDWFLFVCIPKPPPFDLV